MKKINLSITGCMGRMGQQLIRSAKKNKNFNLVSLTENRKLDKKIIGIKKHPKVIKKLTQFFKTKNRVLSIQWQ